MYVLHGHHLILPNVMTQRMFSEDNRFWSSSLLIFSIYPLYVQYFSVAEMDILAHPHKARANIISVYFNLDVFLSRIWENKTMRTEYWQTIPEFKLIIISLCILFSNISPQTHFYSLLCTCFLLSILPYSFTFHHLSFFPSISLPYVAVTGETRNVYRMSDNLLKSWHLGH
jgi:hypothetical protein